MVFVRKADSCRGDLTGDVNGDECAEPCDEADGELAYESCCISIFPTDGRGGEGRRRNRTACDLKFIAPGHNRMT